MDVVVNVLAGNSGGNGVSVLGVTNDTLVTELSGLLSKTTLVSAGITVLEAAMLNANDVVLVLLWKNLAVLDRLHRGVVVVLVNLLVDGGLDVLVSGGGHVLVNDAGGDLLVNGGVMLA